MHKMELLGFLEDHSPVVVTLKEMPFSKKVSTSNDMPHFTAVTRWREYGQGGGVAILIRQDLAYPQFYDIQLTQYNG